MREHFSQLEVAANQNKNIVISCSCTVRYSGRAESFLAQGDRIIMIKPDGTLLIHQPKGSNPINYMKDGTTHDFELKDKKLLLRSYNKAVKEFIDIEIFRIYNKMIDNISDNEKIQLVGSEKDMSDMIYNEPHLIEPGFKPLNREEHTKFGFIDVFGHDKNNTLVVIECKRYIGDPKAVDQLNRYVEKIKASKGLEKVRGVLACPRITPSAHEMLTNMGFEFRSVNPPKYFERYDKDQKRLGEF